MTKKIFSEIMKWGDEEYELEIFEDNDFSKLENVKQVYGFIFDEKENILVIRLPMKEGWGLPGGTPEDSDKSWEETLKREILEEADVGIEEIRPAFYLTSKCITNKTPLGKEGIMLRAIGKVKKILPQTIDPAVGKINERNFIDSKDFLKYCPWGENGKFQLSLALKKLKEFKE
jgi:hypothetical protein